MGQESKAKLTRRFLRLFKEPAAKTQAAVNLAIARGRCKSHQDHAKLNAFMESKCRKGGI